MQIPSYTELANSNGKVAGNGDFCCFLKNKMEKQVMSVMLSEERCISMTGSSSGSLRRQKGPRGVIRAFQVKHSR